VVAIWDYYGFLVCRNGLYFFLGLISHIPGRICDHLQYFGLASLQLAICDLLAHPHSSIPQVQIGFMIVLYRSTSLSRDAGDFLLMSENFHNETNFIH
jgi:hypothetical protein